MTGSGSGATTNVCFYSDFLGTQNLFFIRKSPVLKTYSLYKKNTGKNPVLKSYILFVLTVNLNL